eukprot:118927_1
MGSLLDNELPFYDIIYDNHDRLYVDMTLLFVSSCVVTLQCIIWMYHLHCHTKQSHNTHNLSKTGSSQPKFDSSVEITANSSQSKTTTTTQSNRGNINQTPSTKNPIHLVSSILTTLSIMAAMMFLWLLTIFLILHSVYIYPQCIFYSLVFEIIFSQRLCLYFYYLFRVYLVFKESMYEIDKFKLLIIVAFIVIIWISGQIFFLIYNSVIGNCTKFSVVIAIIPLALTETFVSIFCMVLLVGKLKKLTKGNNIIVSKLRYLTTKLTILAVVSITTTFSILSVFPFTFYLGLMALDTPINILCLMLSFSAFDYYYKILCKPCRKLI